jgi:alkaline phosphatase D
MDSSTIFQHGVASGDPLQDRVMLWTRLTLPQAGPVDVTWELSRDDAFSQIVASGKATAVSEDDHSVHVDPAGLEADTRYFYRFRALGQVSPSGRTRTLPSKEIAHLRFAQVSCAKFNAGFFNAYARIAEQDDLQFLLHLGDYIYEAANLPPAGQTPGADIGRPFEPLHECKTLADYRMRYNQYRRDPDVQRMHASLPIISTVDDHEFADGAWRGGADVHDETRDGPWSERVKTALRVRWEWLPVRRPDPADPLRVYRALHFGKLADLFLISTRIYRDEPVPPPEMYDPNRTQLGPAQREWLLGEFDRSKAAWRILGNPSVLGTTWKKDLPESVKLPLLKTKLINASGDGPDFDQWDGYPAERDLLFRHFRDHRAGNIVVLSGDIHVCMALELRVDPFNEAEEPVAVEFINTSLTSQNFDDKLKWAPRTQSIPYEQELLKTFGHMKYVDLDSHGYNIVDVTPERIQVEWRLVDTVLKRTENESLGAAWKVESGKPRLVRVR